MNTRSLFVNYCWEEGGSKGEGNKVIPITGPLDEKCLRDIEKKIKTDRGYYNVVIRFFSLLEQAES